MTRADPLEEMVAQALMRAGIAFTTPDERRDATGLDFRLAASGVEIEVKRYHTPRVERQLAGANHVILLQGIEAVEEFCRMIAPTETPSGR